MSKETALSMMWHESRVKDRVLMHRAGLYHEKHLIPHMSISLQTLNVRLALSTNGFDPFKHMRNHDI